MSKRIDVIFLDARHTVLAIREDLPPWRTAFGPRGTRSVLELPGRSACRQALAVGDVLHLPQ